MISSNCWRRSTETTSPATKKPICPIVISSDALRAKGARSMRPEWMRIAIDGSVSSGMTRIGNRSSTLWRVNASCILLAANSNLNLNVRLPPRPHSYFQASLSIKLLFLSQLLGLLTNG